MKLSFGGELINIAPKKLLRTTVGMAGFIPALALPSSTTGFFAVQGSAYYQPFSTSNKPDSVTGYITEVNGSDTIVNNGTTLYAQMYRYARTLQSRIRVTCLPSGVEDQVIMSVYAMSYATYTTSTPPLSYTQARSQLGYREAFCHTGTSTSDCTVECELPSWTPMGLTEAQYRDQPPLAVTAGVTAELTWYWVVQYFLANGKTNSATIPFRIELAFNTEFSGPIEMRG